MRKSKYIMSLFTNLNNDDAHKERYGRLVSQAQAARSRVGVLDRSWQGAAGLSCVGAGRYPRRSQLAVFRGALRRDLLPDRGLSWLLAGDFTFHCGDCGGLLSSNDKHKMSFPSSWASSGFSLVKNEVAGVPM